MTLIIWTFNKDPSISILVAVSYFLIMHNFMEKGMLSIAQTGVVPPEVAIMVSGGGGPGIKPQSIIQAEAALLQSAVSGAISGYQTTPQALLSSGPVSTAANASIPMIPSGTPATNPSMMATQPESGGIPVAFTPDDVHDLAVAPR